MSGQWYALIGLALVLAGLVPLGLSVRERVQGNRVRANLRESGHLTRDSFAHIAPRVALPHQAERSRGRRDLSTGGALTAELSQS